MFEEHVKMYFSFLVLFHEWGCGFASMKLTAMDVLLV